MATLTLYRLVDSLPVSHRLLLRYLMLVMRRVCDNCARNEMTSHNAAACIGQCLLWPPADVRMSSDGHLSAAKRLNQLVEKMIDGANEIFQSEDGLSLSQMSKVPAETSKFFV